jgi:hypothetical protein
MIDIIVNNISSKKWDLVKCPSRIMSHNLCYNCKRRIIEHNYSNYCLIILNSESDYYILCASCETYHSVYKKSIIALTKNIFKNVIPTDCINIIHGYLF